jgi:hypothetical protein
MPQEVPRETGRRRRDRRAYAYQDRVFVNPKGYGEDASINITVERDHDNPDKLHGYNIRIRDCFDATNLHGSLKDQEHLTVAIKKIRRMRKALKRFENFLVSLSSDE